MLSIGTDFWEPCLRKQQISEITEYGQQVVSIKSFGIVRLIGVKELINFLKNLIDLRFPFDFLDEVLCYKGIFFFYFFVFALYVFLK
jgi:hypothetical protein